MHSANIPLAVMDELFLRILANLVFVPEGGVENQSEEDIRRFSDK